MVRLMMFFGKALGLWENQTGLCAALRQDKYLQNNEYTFEVERPLEQEEFNSTEIYNKF